MKSDYSKQICLANLLDTGLTCEFSTFRYTISINEDYVNVYTSSNYSVCLPYLSISLGSILINFSSTEPKAHKVSL